MGVEINYRKKLAQKAVTGCPVEDIVYAVFVDMITFHKTPPPRFTIYPQMSLKWKPEDDRNRRSEVPDIGIGNFTPAGMSPPFKLRCGVEAKRAIEIMSSLPNPDSIKADHRVTVAFHKLYFQAEDQAKAAYKNDYPLSNKGIHWILLVGPYWTPELFGPFTEAQSSVRAHKASDSADFDESLKILDALQGPPRPIHDLYLIGTTSSSARLEDILTSTDNLAAPYIDAVLSVSTFSFLDYLSVIEEPVIVVLRFSGEGLLSTQGMSVTIRKTALALTLYFDLFYALPFNDCFNFCFLLLYIFGFCSWVLGSFGYLILT
jgi:hypothetical protein